jgi:hypothetical protein
VLCSHHLSVIMLLFHNALASCLVIIIICASTMLCASWAVIIATIHYFWIVATLSQHESTWVNYLLHAQAQVDLKEREGQLQQSAAAEAVHLAQQKVGPCSQAKLANEMHVSVSKCVGTWWHTITRCLLVFGSLSPVDVPCRMAEDMKMMARSDAEVVNPKLCSWVAM